MKNALLASTVVLALAQAASAQDGLYFGLGLAVTDNSTTATGFDIFEPSARDFGLALTAGYRLASAGTLSFGVEGNLDLMSGKLMSDGNNACASFAPTWCEVDVTARLRGTMSTELSGGSRLTSSLGAVVVRGRAEDGPGNFVSTIGRGLSLGVAWEQVGGGLPVRVDLNYDSVKTDNANNFDRSLDMVGLRVSYMF
ncbi:MAG: hypothetical protein EAZ40_09385 [Rhodobacterales bacterium]|nr:MAG: hypothetical protein EAZ40_09385 [Rhodobacterales bacterium]